MDNGLQGLQESILDASDIEQKHRRASKQAASKLKDSGIVKKCKSEPISGKIVSVSARRSYKPSMFSSYLLSLIVDAIADFGSVSPDQESDSSFAVETHANKRLHALDSFELYLRGRWISYSQQIERIQNLLSNDFNLALIDDYLVLSKRSMPQTLDPEVLNFFRNTMKPAEDGWSEIMHHENKPIIVGVNISMRSKMTTAVANGFSIEPIKESGISSLKRIKEETPWLGEGALIANLLGNPGTRTAFYRLDKDYLGNVAPKNLMDSGGIVSSYIRCKRGVFHVEIPYYVFEDDIVQYEKLASNLVWLADFQAQEAPVPLPYAKGVAEDSKLQGDLQRLVNMIRRMSGKHE